MNIVVRQFFGVSLLCSAFMVACAQTPSAQTNKPAAPEVTRQVSGQTLTSKEIPPIKIDFDKAFKYAGGHTFILYDVANAEQHFFVDADDQGRVKRMYWIQFEGYLPNNSHSYKYTVNKTVDIGGLTFIADAYARNIKINPGRADSDGSRARSFLASKGYRLGSDEVIFQRLVYLIDEAKRNELMIIYAEDLTGLGLTATDVATGGSAASRWDQISKDLLDRAVKGMKISR